MIAIVLVLLDRLSSSLAQHEAIAKWLFVAPTSYPGSQQRHLTGRRTCPPKESHLIEDAVQTAQRPKRLGASQPVEMAIARPTGIAAAIHGPMKGMNRKVMARIPHRMALGTPIR
jgi:hypothetical protein